MDSIRVSEAPDPGSIPGEATKIRKGALSESDATLLSFFLAPALFPALRLFTFCNRRVSDFLKNCDLREVVVLVFQKICKIMNENCLLVPIIATDD